MQNDAFVCDYQKIGR